MALEHENVINARSILMELSGRPSLLKMGRMPLIYGRRMLSTMALEELARRALLRYKVADCGLLRAQRLEKVISGRALQIHGRIVGASPRESASVYESIIHSILQMQNIAHSTVALAAINEVLKKVVNEI